MKSFAPLPTATCLLAVSAVLVAGCGSSANSAGVSTGQPTSTAPVTPTGTGTTAPTPTATTGPSGATTSTTSSTTTTPSGGSGQSGHACVAADLTPSFAGSNGATGHIVLVFVLRNSSNAACHTYGFPGVQFLSRAGSPIKTTATRTTQDFAGTLPEDRISLAPGQQATFRMVTSDVGSNQSDCATAHGLQIIAPDDTTPMRTAIAQGVFFCNGTATVSPLVSGNGANPNG